MLKLVRADVEFNAEGLVLSIKASKMDQFREGASPRSGKDMPGGDDGALFSYGSPECGVS